MERSTVEVYEQRAADWLARRPARYRDDAVAFARRCLPGLPAVDLGAGPGSYLGDLGRPLVALDAAAAMLQLARQGAPDVPVVQGDLEALPFRRGALGGGWARASYLHVRRRSLPLALARLHHCLAVGAPAHLTLRVGDNEGPIDGDDFAGRFFAEWQSEDLAPVVEGAGFDVQALKVSGEWITIDAVRVRTLPDFVGPDMRVLVCGLNPSVIAADAGFGYATPSNRFWRAALASGLMTIPKDPWRALVVDRVGMTDMVKRATPRSSELTREDYRRGSVRLERLVRWLEPAVVLFVGLEGWRAAVDRTARPGLQASSFGGAKAYVMPSTSGLNAHSQHADLVVHMEEAVRLAG